MSDCVFSVDKNQKPDIVEQYYTLSGMEDFIDDQQMPRVTKINEKTFAKKIIRDDGTIRYSVKLNPNGKLYNPVSMYGQDKGNTFLDRVCRSNDRFKNVSLKTFDLYINFLKTKNLAWLNNAEREVS